MLCNGYRDQNNDILFTIIFSGSNKLTRELWPRYRLVLPSNRTQV